MDRKVRKVKKKWFFIAGIVAVISIKLVIDAGSKHERVDNQHVSTSSVVETQKERPYVPKKSSELFMEAKETLEQKDNVSTDEEKNLVVESLAKGMEYLASVNDPSLVQLSYDSQLSITSKYTAQALVMMLLAGYKYDASSVEVFESENDNVYQFIFQLVKSETDKLSITGNYVTGTHQIEIVNIYGNPTGVANK